MLRPSRKFFLILFSKFNKGLSLATFVCCITVATCFIAHQIKKDRICATKVFVSHNLDSQAKSSVLPSQRLLLELETHVNNSLDKINCDFSTLSSLFFLKGDKEKGRRYAKRAYDESLKVFPRSEPFDSLFLMTDLKKTSDSIDTFEAVHDLFMFLETNYPEDKYPLLRTLVLMKLTILSQEFHATTFEEYYKAKLTSSEKFNNLVDLFSEGECSLKTFINKSPKTYKHA